MDVVCVFACPNYTHTHCTLLSLSSPAHCPDITELWAATLYSLPCRHCTHTLYTCTHGVHVNLYRAYLALRAQKLTGWKLHQDVPIFYGCYGSVCAMCVHHMVSTARK